MLAKIDASTSLHTRSLLAPQYHPSVIAARMRDANSVPEYTPGDADCDDSSEGESDSGSQWDPEYEEADETATNLYLRPVNATAATEQLSQAVRLFSRSHEPHNA
jgi:hypothetical protein